MTNSKAGRGAGRDNYYFWMATVVLGIVLLAFAPTFYLCAWIDTPPLPLAIYVHGAVLTSWFVWFFLQALLVRRGRTDLRTARPA